MVSVCVSFIKMSEYGNVTEFIGTCLFYLLLLWLCLAHAWNRFTKYIIFFGKNIYIFYIILIIVVSTLTALIIIIIRSQIFAKGFTNCVSKYLPQGKVQLIFKNQWLSLCTTRSYVQNFCSAHKKHVFFFVFFSEQRTIVFIYSTKHCFLLTFWRRNYFFNFSTLYI